MASYEARGAWQESRTMSSVGSPTRLTSFWGVAAGAQAGKTMLNMTTSPIRLFKRSFLLPPSLKCYKVDQFPKQRSDEKADQSPPFAGLPNPRDNLET